MNAEKEVKKIMDEIKKCSMSPEESFFHFIASISDSIPMATSVSFIFFPGMEHDLMIKAQRIDAGRSKDYAQAFKYNEFNKQNIEAFIKEANKQF